MVTDGYPQVLKRCYIIHGFIKFSLQHKANISLLNRDSQKFTLISIFYTQINEAVRLRGDEGVKSWHIFLHVLLPHTFTDWWTKISTLLVQLFNMQVSSPWPQRLTYNWHWEISMFHTSDYGENNTVVARL